MNGRKSGALYTVMGTVVGSRDGESDSKAVIKKQTRRSHVEEARGELLHTWVAQPDNLMPRAFWIQTPELTGSRKHRPQKYLGEEGRGNSIRGHWSAWQEERV
jgi:hypothetical protein